MKALAIALALILGGSSLALADSIPPASGPVAPENIRYQGFVIDVDTGASLVGACIWAGPTTCPVPALLTDSRGYWALDLPNFDGLLWGMNFHEEGYVDQTVIMDNAHRLILIGLHHL